MSVEDALRGQSVRGRLVEGLLNDPERFARLGEIELKLKVAVRVAMEQLRPVMREDSAVSDDAVFTLVTTLMAREFVEHVVAEALQE